jgi:hypothetical protein
LFRYRAQSVQVRDAGCGGQQQQQQRRPREQQHGPGQGLATQESLVLQGQLDLEILLAEYKKEVLQTSPCRKSSVVDPVFWASRIRIHHYLYGFGSFHQ